MKEQEYLLAIILGFVLLNDYIISSASQSNGVEELRIADCLGKNKIGDCLRRKFARELDRFEDEIFARENNKPPMSVVMKNLGNIIIETIREFNDSSDINIEQNRDTVERRIRPVVRIKKQMFDKFIKTMDILRSKISLVIQILSFGLQIKFFVVAVIGLVVNIIQFWMNVKNKVYNVNQHQHQYHSNSYQDHWARSNNDSEHDLVYKAHSRSK